MPAAVRTPSASSVDAHAFDREFYGADDVRAPHFAALRRLIFFLCTWRRARSACDSVELAKVMDEPELQAGGNGGKKDAIVARSLGRG